MDQTTVQELSKDMKAWGKRQKTDIRVDSKAIQTALEAGKADFEQREFDRDVIAFMHIISSILYNDAVPKENCKFPIERLFEIIDTRTYQGTMQQARKKFASDEEPTDFFRNLYRRFLDWQKNPKRKQNVYARKNFGAKSMENRWELGEFKKEGWMGNDTIGEDNE